jgi:hypothetical protein
MDELSSESLQRQFPSYLTQPEKDVLVRELSEWPRPITYYTTMWQSEVLQGDMWTRLPIRDPETGEVAEVDGIVLSNSCAIDPQNDRQLPAKIVIAPLIDLERYVLLLRKNQLTSEQISSRIQAIREQRIHNVFYLPVGPGAKLTRDHIVLLDDLHSFSADKLTSPNRRGTKLATLATTGFYLFLLKISVHFCRFSENISRYPKPAA